MATEVNAKVAHNYGSLGSIPQYAVKIDGYVGLSSAASETVTNYTVNPFNEDMIILAAYMCITALDAQDADLDIGIADDTAAVNAEDNLFDSPANSALGVLEGLVAKDGIGVSLPIWEASGTATNSYITAQQNANVDSSDLVYNLILIVAPYSKFKAT